jgi:iduronate 2-sulfatase
MKCRVPILLAACLLTGLLNVARADHYDVFLLAGQSNMDGRGAVKDLQEDLAPYATTSSNVRIHFSAGGLRRPLTVSDGLQPLAPGFSGTPGNKPGALPTQTFGPELSFGPAIAKALPGRRILLVKFAEGGTSLGVDWNPGAKDKLYENFIRFVRTTQDMLKANGDTGAIRGMLWHQGEGDAGMAPGKYQAALTEFISRVRTDLELPELPFIIGQVYDKPSRQSLIADQKATAQSVPFTGFAEADDLTTWDAGTHFDAKSQIELGKRFAREMARFLP